VAIVQLMTYIARLVTETQYPRLVANYPDAGYPSLDPPSIDAYLILHRFGAENATYSDELLANAVRLSDGLMRQPTVTRHVGRIVCLDPSYEAGGELVATTRWLHERPDAPV
jgi:hypothetical protein